MGKQKAQPKTVKLKQQKTFSKKKVKVGRKLKRTNETKVTVKTKKIFLGTQFTNVPDAEDKSSASVDLSSMLNELLSGLLSSRADNRVTAMKKLCSRIDQLISSKKASTNDGEYKEKDVEVASLIKHLEYPYHALLPISHLPTLLLRFLRESGSSEGNLRSVTINTLKRCQTVFIPDENSMLSSPQNRAWQVIYEQMCREAILVLFTFIRDEVKWEAASLLGHVSKQLPSAFRLDFADSQDPLLAGQRKAVLGNLYPPLVRLFHPPPQMAMNFTHEKRILVVRTLLAFLNAVLSGTEISDGVPDEKQLSQFPDTGSHLNEETMKISFNLLKMIVRDISAANSSDPNVSPQLTENLLRDISTTQSQLLPTKKKAASASSKIARDLRFLVQFRHLLSRVPLKKTQSDRSIEFLQKQYLGDEKKKAKKSGVGATDMAIFNSRAAQNKLWKAEKKKQAKRKKRQSHN